MTLGRLNSFWRETGKQMGIKADKLEDPDAFACRVLYSALSKWVLTIVHGLGSEVSIIRIQQLIQNKTLNYLKLLPPDCVIDIDCIDEMVYQLLLDNGAFYHLQYNIRPAPYKLIGAIDIAFVRGLFPEENFYYSGLAPFTLESTIVSDLADEFMLWPYDENTTLEMTWKRSMPMDNGMDFQEYLNVERKSGKYYIPALNKKWPFSMARNKQPGNPYGYEHYIILDNQVRRIPSDYIEASVHEYVRLGMMNKVHKQLAAAAVREHVVSLNLDYRLPSPELRFIRYISWPADFGDPKNAFNFVLHPMVWPSVKDRLSTLGYEVIETYD